MNFLSEWIFDKFSPPLPVAQLSKCSSVCVCPDALFIVSSERWQIVKGKSVWAARPETSSLVGWEIGSSEDFFSQSRLWPLWTEKKIARREKLFRIRRKPIIRLKRLSEK